VSRSTRLGVAAAIVGGGLVRGDVAIADGRIVAAGLAGGRGTRTAVPGFVDLQVNGFGGVDFAAAGAAEYRRAGAALLETGVTSFQPTLITAPEEALVAALAEVPAERVGARILGVHLEGPFLSAARMGAHPLDARRDPDLALTQRLLDAGPVTYMTLAPELDGALALIDHLHARGVVVSCGHTDATAAEAAAAFDRGARTVTHLFNAMRPFRHRDPGIAGAALARDDVVVQAIVDGVHLAEATARLVWRAAAGRLALVTDAIGGTRLGNDDVDVVDRIARRADGTLAGSLATMPECIRNLHALGATFEQAVAAATSVPARVLGRNHVGVLRIGGPADVVVLDDRLEVVSVHVGAPEQVAA
jgi:N-acetylglucosamine-6-phosphate deacetylase